MVTLPEAVAVEVAHLKKVHASCCRMLCTALQYCSHVLQIQDDSRLIEIPFTRSAVLRVGSALRLMCGRSHAFTLHTRVRAHSYRLGLNPLLAAFMRLLKLNQLKFLFLVSQCHTVLDAAS